MDDELLSTIERLARAYAKADHTAVLPLDDVLSKLLARTASAEGRESLGRSLAVERLASLIPDISQHSPDLQLSLRDEVSQEKTLNRSPSLDAAALQPVLSLLRVIRNLCAGAQFNQEAFRMCGAHDAVSTVADLLLLTHVQRMQPAGSHGQGPPLPSASPSHGPAPSSDSPASSSPSPSPSSSVSSPPPAIKTPKPALFMRRSSSFKTSSPPPSLSIAPKAFSGSPQSQPSPGPSPSPHMSSGQPPPRTPQALFPSSVEPPDDIQDVLRAVFQVLGNFVNGGSANQQAVWERCYPGTLARCAAVRKARVQEPLCMVLYACCRQDDKRCEELVSNAEGLALLSSLLAAAAKPVPSTTSGAASSSSAAIEESEAGGGGEWLEFLLVRLCLNKSYLPTIFMRLAISKPGSQAMEFVPEQATLLAQLLTAVTHYPSKGDSGKGKEAAPLPVEPVQVSVAEVEADEEEVPSKGVGEGPAEVGTLTAGKEVLDFLADTAKTAAKHLGDKQEARQLAGGPKPKALPTDDPVVDVLGYSLGLLRELTSRLDQSVAASSTGVLTLALHLLKALPPPAASQGSGSVGEGSYPRSNPYLGYRKDLIAIVGNTCYRNQANQDAVRENGALLLVLQQCMVDEENPYLREWGILAVRNILEGNEANQKEIEGLQLQGGAESPVLESAGLKVEVDKESGKPRLVNIGAKSS